MSYTLRDLMEKLMLLDEITVLEVLEITTEDLVERFQDKIEDKFSELEDDFKADEDPFQN